MFKENAARHKGVARPSAGKPPSKLFRPPLSDALPGCLSFGSLLTNQWRKSASHPRLACCPPCGGQRQVWYRGKPPHTQPTVAAAPPPLGGAFGLGYSSHTAFAASNTNQVCGK